MVVFLVWCLTGCNSKLLPWLICIPASSTSLWHMHAPITPFCHYDDNLKIPVLSPSIDNISSSCFSVLHSVLSLQSIISVSCFLVSLLFFFLAVTIQLTQSSHGDGSSKQAFRLTLLCFITMEGVFFPLGAADMSCITGLAACDHGCSSGSAKDTFTLKSSDTKHADIFVY